MKSKLLRFCTGAALSLAGFSSNAAECVVSKINFDTYTELSNPKLEENEWFNDSIRNASIKGPKTVGLEDFFQDGFLKADFKSYATTDNLDSVLFSKNYNFPGCYVQVVNNPRTLLPYLKEFSSGNMLVVAGQSERSPLFSLPFKGLEPGSTVTISFDAISLYSIDRLEDYLIFINEGVDRRDQIREIDLGMRNRFTMQTLASDFSKGSGTVNGNFDRVRFFVSDSYSNGMPGHSAGFSCWEDNIEHVSFSAETDEDGNVTFYFSNQVASLPIGIDNIEVTGTPAPKVRTNGAETVCWGDAVDFYFEGLSDSVSYAWDVNGEKSRKPSLTVTFNEIGESEVSYSLSRNECQVAGNRKITTQACCMDAEGNPLKVKNLFFDDFGEFKDNETYSYVDKNGKVVDEPVNSYLYTLPNYPLYAKLPEGVTSDFPVTTGDIQDQVAIANFNPYIPGVEGDMSGTGKGGMLILDMKDAAPNKVIYRRIVSDLEADKSYSCVAYVGGINNNKGNMVAEVALRLRDVKSDAVLYQEKMTIAEMGWKKIEFSYIPTSSDEVAFEIVNTGQFYGTNQGDIAIDNVCMSTCVLPDSTPIIEDTTAVLPVVVIETSTPNEDLFSLCDDDIVEVNGTYSNLPSFDGDISYLYQYSTDKKNWISLSRIQNRPDFVFNKTTNPLFTNDLDSVYVRLVISDFAKLTGFDRGVVSDDQVYISAVFFMVKSADCGGGNTSVDTIVDEADVVSVEYYNAVGQKIDADKKGFVFERKYLNNGEIINRKVVK